MAACRRGLVRCSLLLAPDWLARVLKGVKIAEGRALRPRHFQSLGWEWGTQGPGRLEAPRPREAEPGWSATSEVGHGRRVAWERVAESDQPVVAPSPAAVLSPLHSWFPLPFVRRQALSPLLRRYRRAHLALHCEGAALCRSTQRGQRLSPRSHLCLPRKVLPSPVTEPHKPGPCF